MMSQSPAASPSQTNLFSLFAALAIGEPGANAAAAELRARIPDIRALLHQKPANAWENGIGMSDIPDAVIAVGPELAPFLVEQAHRYFTHWGLDFESCLSRLLALEERHPGTLAGQKGELEKLGERLLAATDAPNIKREKAELLGRCLSRVIEDKVGFVSQRMEPLTRVDHQWQIEKALPKAALLVTLLTQDTSAESTKLLRDILDASGTHSPLAPLAAAELFKREHPDRLKLVPMLVKLDFHAAAVSLLNEALAKNPQAFAASPRLDLSAVSDMLRGFVVNKDHNQSFRGFSLEVLTVLDREKALLAATEASADNSEFSPYALAVVLWNGDARWHAEVIERVFSGAPGNPALATLIQVIGGNITVERVSMQQDFLLRENYREYIAVDQLNFSSYPELERERVQNAIRTGICSFLIRTANICDNEPTDRRGFSDRAAEILARLGAADELARVAQVNEKLLSLVLRHSGAHRVKLEALYVKALEQESAPVATDAVRGLCSPLSAESAELLKKHGAAAMFKAFGAQQRDEVWFRDLRKTADPAVLHSLFVTAATLGTANASMKDKYDVDGMIRLCLETSAGAAA